MVQGFTPLYPPVAGDRLPLPLPSCWQITEAQQALRLTVAREQKAAGLLTNDKRDGKVV